MDVDYLAAQLRSTFGLRLVHRIGRTLSPLMLIEITNQIIGMLDTDGKTD
jgi:hypothetical protein